MAAVACRFDDSRVIAAGLYQATLESSAAAAPPAKALPVPLPLWVPMPKPPASAGAVSAASAEATDHIMILLAYFIIPLLGIRHPLVCRRGVSRAWSKCWPTCYPAAA